MQYEITWFEVAPTKTGKVKANTTLRDEKGTEHSVSIWDNFPGFTSLRPGQKVTGNIVSKTDANNRIWKSLQPMNNKTIPPTAVSGAVRAAEITAESVEKTMNRKEDGFRTSATFRDATIITSEWMSGENLRGNIITEEGWQNYWKRTRNWLDSQYDQPFN